MHKTDPTIKWELKRWRPVYCHFKCSSTVYRWTHIMWCVYPLCQLKRGRPPPPNLVKQAQSRTPNEEDPVFHGHVYPNISYKLCVNNQKTQVTSSPCPLLSVENGVDIDKSVFWLEAQCCVSYYGNTVWWLMKTVNLDNSTLKRLRHAFLYCSHFSMAGQDGEE